MKWIVYFIMLLLFAFSIFGCEERKSPIVEERQQEQTDKILSEIDRQVGMPNIVNFQQKKLMKMIYEQTDREDLICYVYLQSQWTGKLVYIGKSLGYGVPFSAQYTNPIKFVDDPNGSWDAGSIVIPQADPNGLYMPTSSSATWLLMLDEEGKPHPVYIEPLIVVSPFPLNLSE